MSLNILAIQPSNNTIDVSIDSTIIIEFDNPIDPFTVPNGIGLYTKVSDVLNGTSQTDINNLDIKDENAFYPINFQITGNTLAITPAVSLLPDRTHYISVYPGNDATRYLSLKTVGTPLIVSAASGSVLVNSSYTGNTDDTFEITFSTSDGSNIDTIDVSKGIKFVGSFKFTNGSEINIGELKIAINGAFDIGDSISLPVFKASGLSNVYEYSFTTSKYTTVTPRSNKIEFTTDSGFGMSVVRTIPDNNSIGNKACNPIIVRFNKPLLADQILTNKIRIKRLAVETETVKNINLYYKIENDTLKIYMISTNRQD